MCSISTPHKTRIFTVWLAGNGHGFAVAVLALVIPLDHQNFAETVLRISLNPGVQKELSHLVKWLSLDSKFVVAYKVSSKLVHVFCLQTPITDKCSMRGCKATTVTMATASRRPRLGHDGKRLPKSHPNRSIGERVIAFPTFSNMAAVRHLEFKKYIFGHVTAIEF